MNKSESIISETRHSLCIAGVEHISIEQAEDIRFFDALNDQIESDQPEAEHLQWLLSMVSSAEAILKNASTAGPQCGEQRYRAQAAALSRFHGGLRSTKKPPVPILAE